MTQKKNAPTKNVPSHEETEAVATANKVVGRDFSDNYIDELMDRLTAVVQEVQEAADYFDSETQTINNQIVAWYEEIREALPTPSMPTSNGSHREHRGRVSNEMTIRAAALKAIRKAGRRGLTRTETAKSVLEGGYNHRAADFDGFEKSCYTSAIIKLMQSDEIERHKPTGSTESHYRIKQ